MITSAGTLPTFRPYLSMMWPPTLNVMAASTHRWMAIVPPMAALLIPTWWPWSGNKMAHVFRMPVSKAQKTPAPRSDCHVSLITESVLGASPDERAPRPSAPAGPRDAPTKLRQPFVRTSCTMSIRRAVPVNPIWTKKMLRVETCCAMRPLSVAAKAMANFCAPANVAAMRPIMPFGISADVYALRDMSQTVMATPPTSRTRKSSATDCDV
mmetsp:Transcript_96911/g.279729  ORF Transcript_96911/g.279729 Transcript_96911/m.279729 type:complete len:211 (-) Transcript_96911:445-1077(-)